MDAVSGFWLRLRNRLRFGLATQEILDRLARIGIMIYPYFLVEERIVPSPEAGAAGENLQIRPLRAEEAASIASIPERPRDESKISELMHGATCVAVIENDAVLAYSWFTRHRVWSFAGTDAFCELPPNWAYLFDLYVRPGARGRRLANYLRRRVYQMLAAQGVTHCCSISLAFNRSTRRFKRKLGAAEMELRLLLRLKPLPGLDVRLWRKPWPLKTPVVHVAYRAAQPVS